MNKDYTLVPEPNYHLTKDAGDYRQLTDGKRASPASDGAIWYSSNKSETVGWNNHTFISITIDLEEMKNISEVVIHTTGGGKGGVQYPDYIIGLASVDAECYRAVSYKSSKVCIFYDTTLTKRKGFKLNFNTKARFVKLLVMPMSSFFCDEIKIFAAEQDCPELDGPAVVNSEAIEFAERLRQLERNIQSLQTSFKSSGIKIKQFDSKIKAYKDKLKDFERELGIFKELESLERLFDKIRAEYLNAKHNVPWYCTSAAPLKVLKYEDLPAGPNSISELEYYAWQNEHDLNAFNIVNCSDKSLQFSLNISPLKRGGDYLPSQAFMIPRRAVYVYSKNIGFLADPLVLQGGKSFEIEPGETVQLFAEFNSKSLRPGNYSSAVLVRCENSEEKPKQVIKADIEIARRKFPEKPDFKTCNWDYITGSNTFTNEFPHLAVDDLSRHYLNVTVIHPSLFVSKISSKKRDSDIVLINPRLKKELQLRKHADFVLLLLGFGSGREKYFGQDMYSEEWGRKFASYIRRLVKYMGDLGYSYDNYAIYLYDEELHDDFIRAAKIIRSTNPMINIYANSMGDSTEEIKRAIPYVDIWCVGQNSFVNRRKDIKLIKENCSKVWCYGTMPRRGYPYNIEKHTKYKNCFRILSIQARALGLAGAGFWTYADREGYFNENHFNESSIYIYGVIYAGSNPDFPEDAIYEPIVPSKRWQLWREGLEDAVALKGHQDLLDEFMAKPPEEITSEYLMNLRKRADKKDSGKD
ncbi:hypothetical protein [Sedimentisphaera cyanobacteriorum]|uniref:hypothetical protein n=1 Tax=Sedimentisphaera cyanobacteriorum TaxID=1940790 RepID=UPI000F4E4036|nr:hypothetical protein [Sedimentisphaera cyanobacteriorum]